MIFNITSHKLKNKIVACVLIEYFYNFKFIMLQTCKLPQSYYFLYLNGSKNRFLFFELPVLLQILCIVLTLILGCIMLSSSRHLKS